MTPKSNNPGIKIRDCLWVCERHSRILGALHLLQDTLIELGAEVFTYGQETPPAEIAEKIRRSNKHVILDFPALRLLRPLRRLLKQRGGFSVGLCDWWAFPTWFLENADYLLFRHYNGIRPRAERRCLELTGPTPIFSMPEEPKVEQVMSAILRLPFLAAIPIVAAWRRHKRRCDSVAPERCLYFPFGIRGEKFPLRETEKRYDFANVGSTSFFVLTRDCYAPARMNFINLYADRRRLIDDLRRWENQPFSIFDCRRTRVFGESTSEVIRQSRYAIATGGLHGASVLKYLEIIALGTPVLGSLPAREFPVIKSAVFAVDMFARDRNVLKRKFQEALDNYSAMKDNALAVRERALGLYDQRQLLDMLQAQIDGQPLTADYIEGTPA